MKAAHLQGDVVAICMEAAERITTVGAEQYSDEKGEMFEKENLADTLNLLEEELKDQINYAAMAIMKIRDMRLMAGV